MSQIIIGSRRTAKLPGLFGTKGDMHFWAERGFVRCRDNREDTPETERYTSIDWRAAAHRCLAISNMITQSAEDPTLQHERRQMQQFLVDMEHVLREAKEQHKQLEREAAKKRR